MGISPSLQYFTWLCCQKLKLVNQLTPVRGFRPASISPFKLDVFWQSWSPRSDVWPLKLFVFLIHIRLCPKLNGSFRSVCPENAEEILQSWLALLLHRRSGLHYWPCFDGVGIFATWSWRYMDHWHCNVICWRSIILFGYKFHRYVSCQRRQKKKRLGESQDEALCSKCVLRQKHEVKWNLLDWVIVDCSWDLTGDAMKLTLWFQKFDDQTNCSWKDFRNFVYGDSSDLIQCFKWCWLVWWIIEIVYLHLFYMFNELSV